MAEELLITVLGTPRVSLDDRPVTGFVSSKAQGLVYYLAVTGKAHTREALAGLFWSELPDAAARRNLRNALSNLRQLIGPYLLITRQTVSLDPKASFRVDCERFAVVPSGSPKGVSPNAEELASLSAAVELYQGEFLAGFYVADAPLFEEWVLAERERLRLALESALERLVHGHSTRREYKRAIAFAQRWSAVDPLREAAHRALMELYAWSGDRSAALRRYDACVQVLDEELGVQPSEETVELCRRIRAGELEGRLVERREPVIRGYEIRERIGGGAYGIVYRAYQTQVGREVAIKAILPHYANHPDFIRRFETESQLVARLEHPHIVPLYDYWREPDGAYLVMRWLRGGNLQSALQRGPWNPEAATRLVDQISAALAAAHRQGVVHRDLKPANILLDDEDNAYLSDFGIAKDLLHTTARAQTAGITGSPGYISPEQIRSEAITPMSDIYSLGVVLFELLTGEHPFADESLPALLHKHLNEALPLATALRPDLPSAVDAVIQKATAKDPAQRFQDVLSLADAFRQALMPQRLVRQAQDGSSERSAAPGAVSAVVGDALAEPVNPYKGLRPFYEADAVDFFGREALTERLLAQLASSPIPFDFALHSIPTQQEAGPRGPFPEGGVPSDELPGGRFLAVVGPSGSGKSSVVRAGLVPALRRGALPGSENWFVIQMLPGAHPLEELETALLRIAVNPPESLLNQMREDERGLLRAVKRALPEDEADEHRSELVLVVDQFEEVFILVRDEDERAEFLAALMAAVTDPRSSLRVVVTLRADFFDRPLGYAGVGELMRQRTEVVLPLSSAELERAIAEPAERVGLKLEPGLLAEIVGDVTDQPGALPLLQYALTELFERRSGNSLTIEAYRDIGGVSGALGRRAEELFEELDAEGREAARQLFLRLVTLGEVPTEGLPAPDTRRRVRRAELEGLAGDDGGQVTVMDLVIDLYSRYRLFTLDRDPVTRGPTVEVAHEALLREWRRLREWLDASREDLRTHRRLTSAATEWIDANRDAGFLLRGSRLEQFEDWAAETDLALTTVERDYLETSVTLRERRRAERERERELAEEQRRQAEVERQRAEEQARRSRQLRWLAGGLAGALLLAVVATTFARTQWLESQGLLRLSVSHRLTAAAISNLDRYPERSVLLALEAASATYSADESVTREANHALRRAIRASRTQLTLFGHGGPVMGIAFSPECAYLHSPSELDSQPESAAGRRGGTAGPCGARLATSSGDRTVKVWDAASGEELFTLTGHNRPVRSVSFNPNGARLATASEDGTAKIWDAATGEELLTLVGHTGPVLSVAFSADGAWLATSGEDETARVWNAASGEEYLTLTGHVGPVYSVAFGPGCAGSSSPAATESASGGEAEPCRTLLAAAGDDNTVKVWALGSRAPASGEEILTLHGHKGAVGDVAYSPDGAWLATASMDGTARVWNAASGDELLTITGHAGPVRSVAFSPRCARGSLPSETGTATGEGIVPCDRYLVTTGDDETAKLWDISTLQRTQDGAAINAGSEASSVATTGEALLTLSGHTGPIWSVVFNPDGTRLATASADRTARVWNISANEELLTISGHSGTVWGIAFSPDCVSPPEGGPERCGTRLATSGDDQQTRIWDAASGDELLTIFGHTGIILYTAFSPDGERLATASADGTARVWDADSGEELLTLSDHTHWVVFLAFSPDGTRLATASADETARVWDMGTGDELLNISGHTGWVLSVAFSPNGTRLATTGRDGLAKIWDVASGRELLTLSGHTGWVFGAAFNPDGTRLATAGEDGTARVWDAASGRELLTISGHTGWVLSIAFSPDGERLATASEDGTARVWEAVTGDELLTFSSGSDIVNYAAFSPDGTRLAVSEEDGTARVYLLDMDELMALACSRLTRNLTEAEWEAYMGRDVAYRRTCPNLPVPPPWLTYDHIE